MILHILRNDITHLRRWLLLWAGLLALMPILVLGLHTPFGWNIGYWDFLKYGVLAGFLIQMLFQALMVMKSVQKENLQNAKSYWLTRPIGRGHLVAAKYLFWLLLVVLPQVIQCALIGAIFPGSWQGALDGMGSILTVTLLLGFITILAGSVTKDTGQALLIMFVAPFALLIAGHLIILVLGSAMPVERLLYSFTAIPYLGAALIGFSLLGSVFVYCWQMHHPANRWRYRAVCFGLLALAMIAGKIPSDTAIPSSTMTLPEGAQLEIGRKMFTRTDRPLPGSRSQNVQDTIQLWLEGGTGSDYGLKAQCEWHGLPAGWLTQLEAVRSYDSEGRWLRPREEKRRNSFNQRAYGTEYIGVLFPGAEVANQVTYGSDYEQLFSSPFVRVDEVGATDQFTTVFMTRFYSPEKARLSFGLEAKVDLGETRLRLESIERQGNDLVLKFHFIGVGSLGRELGNNLDGGFLALRDPASGRVAIGRRGGGSASSAFGLMTAGVFEISFQKMAVPAQEMSRLELYYVKQNLVGTYVEPIRYTIPVEY